MEKEELKRYEKCVHYVPDFNSEAVVHRCAPNAKTLGEQWEQAQEINPEGCETCEKFKSRYIEYPLTIQGLDIKKPEAWNVSFCPVRVRLCEDDKTYFGILLGEFPWHTNASYNEESGMLKISTMTNPCILLPREKKVVFGAESWWSKIEQGEDISDITDEDINDQWYMKLAKELAGEEGVNG